MWTRTYLSIGTNMGNRVGNLKQALGLLNRRPEIRLMDVSSLYETAPVGGVAQANFLNLAVALETRLSAKELLNWLHVIEQSLHRRRLIHWGPRTIDLDIVMYGRSCFNNVTLKVPHPEMGNRRFVLVPMTEVAVKGDRERIEELLKITPDREWIDQRLVKKEVAEWIKKK